MRFILLIALCLCARADWKSDLRILWFNNANPGIALTSTSVHQIDHAVGSVTRIQVGDQTGILTNLCTGIVTGGTCGPMQNCEYDRDHKNLDGDTLLFVTCRPITTPTSYIATNLVPGQVLTYFSTVTKTWVATTITFTFPGSDHLVTFADTTTAWAGVFTASTTPTGGDSGSPVFTQDGDFCGSIVGTGGGGTGAVCNFLYPSGSTYRPVTPSVTIVGGGIYDDGD